MIDRRTFFALSLGTAVACAGPIQAATPPKAAVATVEMRIDVGADGRVTAAEPTRPVAAPLADAVRRHVAGWTFTAPRRDGAPVAGTTYARMGICAAPSLDGTGLDIKIGSASNGPGVDARMMGISFFPPLPRAVIEGGRMELDAIYEVGKDGRATLVSVTTIPDRPGMRRPIETALRKWFHPMRFEPERIDGQPVATRVRLPMTFTFSPTRGPVSRKELERMRIEASPTCQALLKERADAQRPQVALDSPYQLPPG